MPHQKKWTDEKSVETTEIAVLHGYCCRQHVEGNGMGHGGPTCSSLCSIASSTFLEEHVAEEKWNSACCEDGSHQHDRMDTFVGSSQRMRRVGYGGVKMGGREGMSGMQKDG